jgi:ankyrin repeat protein
MCPSTRSQTKRETVKYVAEHCLNADAINNNGESPVMYAAQKGNLGTLQYLTEKKNANVYLSNKNCETYSSEPGGFLGGNLIPENGSVHLATNIVSLLKTYYYAKGVLEPESTVIKHSDVM